MIKMTYVTNGKKVELDFDTVEELEQFNEGRLEKLEQKLKERLKEAEDSLEAATPEIYELLAKAFLTAKKAGFSPEALFDLMGETLEDLAAGHVILGENGGLLYKGTPAEDAEDAEDCGEKGGCKGCGHCDNSETTCGK